MFYFLKNKTNHFFIKNILKYKKQLLFTKKQYIYFFLLLVSKLKTFFFLKEVLFFKTFLAILIQNIVFFFERKLFYKQNFEQKMKQYLIESISLQGVTPKIFKKFLISLGLSVTLNKRVFFIHIKEKKKKKNFIFPYIKKSKNNGDEKNKVIRLNFDDLFNKKSLLFFSELKFIDVFNS